MQGFKQALPHSVGACKRALFVPEQFALQEVLVNAAQFTGMKGFWARGLLLWMARATSSFGSCLLIAQSAPFLHFIPSRRSTRTRENGGVGTTTAQLGSGVETPARRVWISGSCCVVPHTKFLVNSLTDDWSWLKGNHFFTAGATILLGTQRSGFGGSGLLNGQFGFSGNFTGNSVADLLFGNASSFSQSNNYYRKYITYTTATPYFEDHWKITRRLTLSAGLRFLFAPWSWSDRGVPPLTIREMESSPTESTASR